MENYTKLNSKPVVEELKEPWDIYVGSGSKVKAVINKALKTLEEGEKVVIIGYGPTINKTITCVEILKRKNQDLYQNNKLFYKRMEDTWEPNKEDLDRPPSGSSELFNDFEKLIKVIDKENKQMLTVTRNVPAIKIVLSKVPLDVDKPGYQAPVHARRKNTSDYQKRNRSSHPAKKTEDAAEKKHKSQRKEQMPKSKRFRPSQDKLNTNYVGKF